MRTIILFLVIYSVARADVIFDNNRTTDVALFDSSGAFIDSLNANTTVNSYGYLTFPGGTVQVLFSNGHREQIEVLDGTYIELNDQAPWVSSSTPLSSWAEVFAKGFGAQCVFELFGLMIRLVYSLRQPTGGDV